jgi:anti-sigma factor RsiW
MNLEEQLKLQALLDGELPPAEACELSAAIDRDPAAAARLAVLKQTRQSLQQAEFPRPLPESREFYWSKIERDLRRLSPPSPARSESGLFSKLRLLVLPAAAVAALIIVALAGHYYPQPVAQRTAADADAPTVEPALASTDATTYRDASEGTTLVWFSDKTAAVRPAGTNRVN